MDKIDRLLEMRAQADLELEKLRTPVTVLFTDIKDSTAFFESQGDVEGLSMVHRHNSLLFPIVQNYGGRVVKTVGDAIMASFEDPGNAIKAAIGMQKALENDNKGRPPNSQIHIRVGIHTGLGLIKDNDVYGDVVNTASRVEHQAEPDQIVISDSLLETAKSIGAPVADAGRAELKGKTEELELYTVAWPEFTLTPPATPAKPSPLSKPVAAFVLLVAVTAVGLFLWSRSAVPVSEVQQQNEAVSEPASSEEAAATDLEKKESVSRGQLCDALLADAAIQDLLKHVGKPVSRDEMLAGGLRGLEPQHDKTAETPVTRAEFALILEDLLIFSSGDSSMATKFLGAETSPLIDVQPAHPAFNAVMTVTTHGLLNPETSGSFHPNAPVTRAEMEEALGRLSKILSGR